MIKKAFLFKKLIKEVVLQLGSIEADIGNPSDNVDLLYIAQKFEKSRSKRKNDLIEDLIALNSAIYHAVGSRSAWEDIGERMLQTWGFEVPTQGGQSGESVLTFWDVKRNGILYSVKTSISKGPTKENNFRFATQSSNIKFSSLVGAIKENSPGTRLGNIGCIYSETDGKRIIQWGEVTKPITAKALKTKILSLIPTKEEKSIFEKLTSSKTGKKMSGQEMKDLKRVENSLSDYISSGGRLTEFLPMFLGEYTENTLCSLTVYDPEIFWNVLGRKTSQTEKTSEKEKIINRIKSISFGLEINHLVKILNYARELYEES